MHRVLTFQRMLWIGGLLLAIAVATGPLLRERLARWMWTPVPCVVDADGKRFAFQWRAKWYVCSRANLWYQRNSDARETAIAPETSPNAQCFVNGAEEPVAVLRLDASRHLEGGMGNFAAAGIILGALVGLSIADRRHMRRAGRKIAAPRMEEAALPSGAQDR